MITPPTFLERSIPVPSQSMGFGGCLKVHRVDRKLKENICQSDPPAFFALGQFRKMEKAYALLHSNFAMNLFDLGQTSLGESPIFAAYAWRNL